MRTSRRLAPVPNEQDQPRLRGRPRPERRRATAGEHLRSGHGGHSWASVFRAAHSQTNSPAANAAQPRMFIEVQQIHVSGIKILRNERFPCREETARTEKFAGVGIASAARMGASACAHRKRSNKVLPARLYFLLCRPISIFQRRFYRCR